MSHWILLIIFIALGAFAQNAVRRGKLPYYLEGWAVVFWLACVGAVFWELILIIAHYV